MRKVIIRNTIEKIGVASMVEKKVESHLRWFGQRYVSTGKGSKPDEGCSNS